MRILLTNDDGYDQPGLVELENLLKHDHEIWVVAPLHHCSGTSHALGLYSSMELKEEGYRKWSLEGTPTDCVKVALMEVMKDNPPDLLISGINPGANLANNIFYSGTVAAATEAALWDITSIAVSVQVTSSNRKPFFRTASCVLESLMEKGIAGKIPKGTILNINVPEVEPEEIAGMKWTKMARFASDISFRQLEPGRVFAYDRYRSLPVVDHRDSDVDAVNSFMVSLTLLDSNRTSSSVPPDLEFTDGGS
ncbi:MAG: 5'/3'-nucleotidase SurE [Candidatus Aegiribacteria sp.]|nr:5'/3'-nucleotidase SurE [Candidatus Aegiribacteria sp.]